MPTLTPTPAPTRRLARRRLLRLAGCLVSAAAGSALLPACEPMLETGYKPRPLNATDADRRAYYAPPFSAEAESQKTSGTGFNLTP